LGSLPNVPFETVACDKAANDVAVVMQRRKTLRHFIGIGLGLYFSAKSQYTPKAEAKSVEEEAE
jgi:hypothetical protein